MTEKQINSLAICLICVFLVSIILNIGFIANAIIVSGDCTCESYNNKEN